MIPFTHTKPKPDWLFSFLPVFSMSNTNQTSHLYIDTLPALNEFCQQLANVKAIAVDTEFIREKSYYSNLCLIQVASPDHIACIDPLALEHIDPLLDILYDNNVVKVMHAARQDLEIFYNMRGTVPAPIFDTQLAATVLGYGEQVGYSKLVEAMLGVPLQKGYARTDWSKRPLSTEQLQYAADDVRYLIQLYPDILEKLHQQGRDEWLNEDFAALSEPDLYEVDPDSVWQRVSGQQRLHGVKLAILQALARWRENQAKKLDRPRKWVLADDLLVAMTQQAPTNPAQFSSLRGLPARLQEKHQTELLSLIDAAKQCPKEQWPKQKNQIRTTAQEDALADCMMGLLRLRAAEHQIAPAALATRKDIDKIIKGERDLPVLHGWRAQVTGHDLLELLAGKIQLHVIDGQLTGVYSNS